MYSIRPNLILGFHGCDLSVVKKVINGEEPLQSSHNEYDWLGSGVYFWENDYERALDFAKEAKKRKGSGIRTPAVIGAVICLENCLDLTTQKSIIEFKQVYETLKKTIDSAKFSKIQNKGKNINGDHLLRYKDRFVIESLHEFRRRAKYKEYDSVKAAFWEGSSIYENAGFKEKNHIQICIRNPKCILGYFLPLN